MKKLIMAALMILALSTFAYADTETTVEYPASNSTYWSDVTFKGKKIFIGEPISDLFKDVGKPTGVDSYGQTYHFYYISGKQAFGLVVRKGIVCEILSVKK